MKSEELLKEKRAKLLSEIIDKIKLSIEKNKVKGENASKIFIYSRLADYTYYSEVSIRKFLTGTVPKDITSFVEGVIQYCKLVGIEEEYIENFENYFFDFDIDEIGEMHFDYKLKKGISNNMNASILLKNVLND